MALVQAQKVTCVKWCHILCTCEYNRVATGLSLLLRSRVRRNHNIFQLKSDFSIFFFQCDLRYVILFALECNDYAIFRLSFKDWVREEFCNAGCLLLLSLTRIYVFVDSWFSPDRLDGLQEARIVGANTNHWEPRVDLSFIESFLQLQWNTFRCFNVPILTVGEEKYLKLFNCLCWYQVEDVTKWLWKISATFGLAVRVHEAFEVVEAFRLMRIARVIEK